MNTAITALCIGVATLLIAAAISIVNRTKPTTTQDFIDVCIQTGGQPRVVESDVDGLVMTCLYEIPSTDYEETRHRGEA